MNTEIQNKLKSKLKSISKIAQKIELKNDEISLYGAAKAKISDKAVKSRENNLDGKLILVTAISPTPAGEGKTTMTIGLGDALASIGKKTMIALREPSLGPVFGVKGGATGGGLARVEPMEDINLHFTGDIHAVTAANNLLCAMIDNHIYQGNELEIDKDNVVFLRAVDSNDRALRNIVAARGGGTCGIERNDSFQITAASEIMAVLCLASDYNDLKKRLSEIICAYSVQGKPVTAAQIGAAGAMAALLKDALSPNLVQTLYGTPCLIHGGPFGNIAHGCSSIRATKLALKLSDYVLTEAGFGSDLGAEKFMDIKCRAAGISPDAVVLVVTTRALKYNGGVLRENLKKRNLRALMRGIYNLEAHIEGLKNYGVPMMALLNRFEGDHSAEISAIKGFCESLEVDCAVSSSFGRGAGGGRKAAEMLISILETKKADYSPLYESECEISEKIETIAKKIYGAGSVTYSNEARTAMERAVEHGYGTLPVCIAKTQYSLSDDPTALGSPKGFELKVSGIKVSAGAGFIVVYTGNILTMPGLPKKPSALGIDLRADGEIAGLF